MIGLGYQLVTLGNDNSLLQAAARIWEYRGPMMHAKTSVNDGIYSRVGSTNLNVTGLMTNWEIDVIVEQPGGMGVIAGQADHGLVALMGADFRNRDALQLGLDGNAGPPWAGGGYTANANKEVSRAGL